jgi:ABC-type cobalt transport system substrate-binding protein
VLEDFATGEGEGDWAGVAGDFSSGVADAASDSPGFEPVFWIDSGAPVFAEAELPLAELELAFSDGSDAEARVVAFLLAAGGEPFFESIWFGAPFSGDDLLFASVTESGRVDVRALAAPDSRSPGTVKTISSLFPRCST